MLYKSEHYTPAPLLHVLLFCLLVVTANLRCESSEFQASYLVTPPNSILRCQQSRVAQPCTVCPTSLLVPSNNALAPLLLLPATPPTSHVLPLASTPLLPVSHLFALFRPRAAPIAALTSALDAPEEVLEAALSFLQAEDRPLLQALPNTAASLEVRFHR